MKKTLLEWTGFIAGCVGVFVAAALVTLFTVAITVGPVVVVIFAIVWGLKSMGVFP